MRLEIRMPKVSEYSDEGRIAKWRVSVGDVVQKDEIIADVEVDMDTLELKAGAPGKIAEIWVHAGQAVPVETVIAMQTVDEDYAPEDDQQAAQEVEEGGEGEGTAGTPPDQDSEEEAFPELGSEAATRAAVNDNSDEAVVQYGHILASPAAVALAEQYNVNLETVTGTGQCGRIEREDVEASMQSTSQFITPEDVDDLMNFDGDFSSRMPADEAADDQPESLEASEAWNGETEEESPISEEMPGADSSVADEDAFAADTTAETAGSVEPQPDPEETDPAGEVAPQPGAEEEQSVAEAVGEEGPADESAAAADDGLEETSADVQEAAVGAAAEEPVRSTEQVDEASEGDVSIDIESGALADDLGEDGEAGIQQDEAAAAPDADSAAVDEDPADEAAAPGIVYMGAGPEVVETSFTGQPVEEEQPEIGSTESGTAAEIATEEASEEPVPVASATTDYSDEAAAPEIESEVDDDAAISEAPGLVSAYQPTDEEVAAISGFSPESNDEEPEALAVDESDTIESDEIADIESAVTDELGSEFPDEPIDDLPDDMAVENDSSGEDVSIDAPPKSVKVRRLVARKMEKSWHNAPHFFVTVAVDMTDVIRFRTDLGVTINDFILAATSRALQEHPWVNCHFIDDEAVEQSSVNISLAVETENGLYYPVMRDCAGKSVKDLGLNAAELVLKAHSGKLTEEDMDGGTFTISNMGMLGVESFSAIITPPQVAVLAIGTVRGEVIVDEHEEMVMAPMVRLTLSADHRALDGADAADFLGTMKSYLEAPITLVASQDD